VTLDLKNPNTVWEAAAAAGSRVALKFLPCPNAQAAARAIRALQTFRQITHPNLMAIDHLWLYRDYLVIETKLGEGSLDDLSALHCGEYGAPLPAAEVCRYLLPVAKTLDFLHARSHRIDGTLVGFQHGNVKPSNILLMGEDIQLSDFDRISILGPWKKELFATERSGAASQVRGQNPQETDQHALALCYCQLRSGSSHPGGYPHPVMASNVLDEDERRLIERALSSSSQCRWGSCTQLIEKLSNHVGSPFCDMSEGQEADELVAIPAHASSN
jgi:serine/threonine protein kinase